MEYKRAGILFHLHYNANMILIMQTHISTMILPCRLWRSAISSAPYRIPAKGRSTPPVMRCLLPLLSSGSGSVKAGSCRFEWLENASRGTTRQGIKETQMRYGQNPGPETWRVSGSGSFRIHACSIHPGSDVNQIVELPAVGAPDTLPISQQIFFKWFQEYALSWTVLDPREYRKPGDGRQHIQFLQWRHSIPWVFLEIWCSMM